MAAFFQLIRWRNLLIVFATQLVIWYFVVWPVKPDNAHHFFLGPLPFLLLTLSTICIAAAGYIINDYFDLRIDAVNKPDKLIIEKKISRRSAILWHTFFNVVGVYLAFVLCYKLRYFQPLVLQILCTALLWFYSTHFKRQYVIGNVVVALLTALTVLILAFYEPSFYRYVHLQFFIRSTDGMVPNPFWVIMVYAYFAFMLTWMREIVKDMEDYKGDVAEGCDTMPIRLGLVRSARFVIVLGILTLSPLLIAAYKLLLSTKMYLGIYVLVALILPVCIFLYQLPQSTAHEHYARQSSRLKLIMLLGIFALVAYHF